MYKMMSLISNTESFLPAWAICSVPLPDLKQRNLFFKLGLVSVSADAMFLLEIASSNTSSHHLNPVIFFKAVDGLSGRIQED